MEKGEGKAIVFATKNIGKCSGIFGVVAAFMAIMATVFLDFNDKLFTYYFSLMPVIIVIGLRIIVIVMQICYPLVGGESAELEGLGSIKHTGDSGVRLIYKYIFLFVVFMFRSFGIFALLTIQASFFFTFSEYRKGL